LVAGKLVRGEVEKMNWESSQEVVAEEGTTKVVPLKVMYLTKDLRLCRRVDTMPPGIFAVERLVDGAWEVEADAYDLGLVELK